MLPHRQANPSPNLARPGQAEFGQHESGQDWQAKHNLPFYAGLDTNDGIRYRLTKCNTDQQVNVLQMPLRIQHRNLQAFAGRFCTSLVKF